MKRNLLLPLFVIVCTMGTRAQVTQINSNNSLEFDFPLSAGKHVFVSKTDSTLWATDGTLAGTIPLSATIKFIHDINNAVFLNGKLIFSGTTAATGIEVFVTDGTPGGTGLVLDINPGAPDSSPDDETAILNGFLYFTAERPLDGRELWRTNGTPGGTTLVKDIVPFAGSSNDPGSYHLFSSGTYLLFAARTPSSGIELYKSDGTAGGTAVLMDINTGNAGADSSNPGNFYLLNNNTVLFTATDASHGKEIWTTNGTPLSTFMLKDINPGTAGSTTFSLQIAPGIFTQVGVFNSFHTFNNKAYFMATDGTTTSQMYSTDGSILNTAFVKDIVPGASFSFVLLVDAVNLPNKFIFPVSDFTGRSELWSSDGTQGGTNLFKSFIQTGPGQSAFIAIPFSVDFTNATVNQALFQGDKFFFTARTPADGYELWISDGVDATVAHTHLVKDINGGTNDGISNAFLSFTYTSSALFFPADNGTNGVELWKSDGTSAGTNMVADIITGPDSSNPNMDFLLVNGKVVFQATNGDSPTETDLYAVDGSFSPLPVSLADFTAIKNSGDALLQWHTLQELNSRDFTVERSFDGVHFNSIGMVTAAGNSSMRHGYNFTDAGIFNSGNSVVYYRLRATDKDGKSTLSTVITLRLKGGGPWKAKLMANPVTDQVRVLLTGLTENVQLSILDMNGRKIYYNVSAAVSGQVSLFPGNLPRGSYVLVAVSQGETQTMQFVK